MPQFFWNGEDAMPVSTMNQLEGHGGGTVNGVHVAAGRTETAVATERNELEVAAFGASVHGTAKRGIPAVDHLFNVFDDSLAWM